MSVPYVIQGDNVTVIVDNSVYSFYKTHLSYSRVIDAIKKEDWDQLREVIDPKKVVLSYGKGNISIQGDVLFWKGKEFHNSLADRMINMLREGFSLEPMVLFMENLMTNPSNNSVTQLYSFLEKCSLPITPDGHFLAFKKVTSSYQDVYSRTVDNRPAHLLSDEEKKDVRQFNNVFVSVENGNTVVKMQRNDVDDNMSNECSHGLHFCSKNYLSVFGGERTLIVKINPRDVVSVPADYSYTKARCCRYEIVGELEVSPDKAFESVVQENANQYYYEDEEEDDDYYSDDEYE